MVRTARASGEDLMTEKEYKKLYPVKLCPFRKRRKCVGKKDCTFKYCEAAELKVEDFK